ncbi:ABC transporter permease [Aestuariibacter halophilus]|uniref:ABC transporter permease n=1 Tax=Fluctibacter halophilus TaxID=226011 RepID=A0ABS8G7S3_9ALTE|nr:ABC transporter permease [Aestuariibacter halophilus]MCC2616131.1 ABC transporter permease [Aestuariibacter halophilus]
MNRENYREAMDTSGRWSRVWQPSTLGIILWCILMGFVLSFQLAVIKGLNKALPIPLDNGLSIVTEDGASAEADSQFSPSDTQTLLDYLYHLAPQMPISAETVTELAAEPMASSTPTLMLRGVPAIARELHGVKLLSGRWFDPQARELVVGQQVLQDVPQSAIGHRYTIADQHWQVVGVFSASYPHFDNELWGPVVPLQTALGQGGIQALYLPQLSANMHRHLQQVFSHKLGRAVQVASVEQFYAYGTPGISTERMGWWVVLLAGFFIVGVIGAWRLSVATYHPQSNPITLRRGQAMLDAMLGAALGVLGFLLALILLDQQYLELGNGFDAVTIPVQLTLSTGLLVALLTAVIGGVHGRWQVR